MDEGVFPVPGSLLTSQRYRDVMETIIAATTSRNIKYVDGIYPLLNDTKGIDQVCQYLQRYGVPLGKLSVHKNHIDRIVGFKPKTVFAPTPKPAGYVTVDSSDDHVSHVDKLSLARQIVEVYEARNRARSIAKLPGHYLSPQMYMLARQYLEKHQPSQAPTERTLQSHQ